MDNAEIKYYQPKFKKWIMSEKWDIIAEKLPEITMDTTTMIMRAKKDGDCSWVVWKNADYALECIRKIAKNIQLY